MVYGNFMPLAERDDFLIVAPDGQGEGINRHFNLTGERNLQDDLAMVQTLLDHIEATFCVDTKRVYSTGMSDGGAMTSFLACRASDRFAAFGPVAVVVFVPGCAPTRPIPIAAFSRRALQRWSGALLRRRVAPSGARHDGGVGELQRLRSRVHRQPTRHRSDPAHLDRLHGR
jgi:acetyl esterase/lipase